MPFGDDTAAPAPPLDAPSAAVENHSCARKTSGPSAFAVPASPPAGSIDPPPSGCPAFAPLRPASGFPPVSPAAACRFRSATVPELLAIALSGSPVIAWTVIPSTPGLPLLALTRFNASLRFSRSTTSSINRSISAGLSVPRFAASDSVPSPSGLGASPLRSSGKANCIWFFCRLSLMSRAAYSPFPLCPLSTPFGPSSLCTSTTPDADFCRTDQDDLHHPQSRIRDLPQISRGKFDRLPCIAAESTFCALDGYGLRETRPARPTLTPYIRFLFIGSHVCSTLPSDPASRRSPLRFANPSPPSGWVEDFHLQAVEHARHTIKKRGVTLSVTPRQFVLCSRNEKLAALLLTAPPAAESSAPYPAAAARNPAAAHENASTHAHSNGRRQCVHCARCHSPARAAASAPDYR